MQPKRRRAPDHFEDKGRLWGTWPRFMSFLWSKIQHWRTDTSYHNWVRAHVLYFVSQLFFASWAHSMPYVPQSTQERRIGRQVAPKFQHSIWVSHEGSAPLPSQFREMSQCRPWYVSGYRGVRETFRPLHVSIAWPAHQTLLLQRTPFNFLSWMHQRPPQPWRLLCRRFVRDRKNA